MLSRYELRRFRGVLPVLALLFALLVPVIYGAVYLYANWDPYGNLTKLPVALVNEDSPVTLNDETIAAGDDVQREILEQHTFDWRVTSRADAEAGLVEGRYYLVMEIPEDFSEDLVSGQSADPQRAQITLRRNDANGFVIGSVTGSAQTKIENAVDKAAVDAYFKAVFKNLATIREGMDSAASGADQLASGLADAHTGSADLTTGLETAQSGSGDLLAGLRQADAGAGRLAAGASELDRKLPQLKSGADQVHTGLDQLTAGSSTLADGAHQVADGTQRLNDTVLPVLDTAISVQQTVATDVQAIDARVQQINDTVQGDSAAAALSAELSAASARLDALAEANPDIADSPQFADARAALERAADRAGTIESTVATVATDSATVNQKVQSFVADDKAQQARDDLTALNDGAHRVASGADDLTAGAGRAADGAGSVASGVGQVADAVDQLADGSGSLATGLDRLVDGGQQLDDGLTRLVTGSEQLETGLGRLLEGAQTLRDGLASGVRQIPLLTEDQQDAAALVLSSPVQVGMDVLNPATYYGRGLAPLFFSIAMWVFGISGFLVMRPISGRLLAGRLHPLRLAVSAWLPFGTVALAGALLMLGITWWGMGLDPVHPVATVLLTALGALVFSGIAHLMRMALGLPGSALLLVWLVLQLSATGGTYPVEVLPPFFAWIHPFMPISYTIDAFRVVISGGQWAHLMGDVAVLVGIGAAALVLDVLAVMARQRFRMSDLHPPLEH